MCDLNRDAIKARVEAATPGPWDARTTGRSGGDHWYICDIGEAIAHISARDGENEAQRQPDAEFIAHARDDVPALLDALEEAERERYDALAVIDKTLDNIDPESEYENPGVPEWTHAEVREMLQFIRAALHPVAETTEEGTR